MCTGDENTTPSQQARWVIAKVLRDWKEWQGTAGLWLEFDSRFARPSESTSRRGPDPACALCRGTGYQVIELGDGITGAKRCPCRGIDTPTADPISTQRLAPGTQSRGRCVKRAGEILQPKLFDEITPATQEEPLTSRTHMPSRPRSTTGARRR